MVVAVAVVMGLLAFICSKSLGYPLRDPDGFLGPAWLRLPLLVAGAFIADIVPRTLFRARGNPGRYKAEATLLIKEHWTKDRITLVVVGLISFYVTYVSYRNLKNFLPFIMSDGDGRPTKYDYALHRMDEWMLFGHDPSTILHNVLGTGVSAHVLSWIYLIFLPMVPISIVIWAVWSRNVSFGYWFITAQCICWALGTLSYYVIPTLGPNFFFPWLYKDLPDTGVAQLQDGLFNGRQNIRFDPFADGVQSVAGFASLHVAITVSLALVAQYTLRTKAFRVALWTYSGLTILATTYFGWHYIADDIAGLAIAIVAVYLAALGTGQKFERWGRRSHPTTSTDEIPIDDPDDELAPVLSK
ncbi:inositol phosphorylceramide synthase [Nocardioides marmoriginsengisoli]|uniref:Inositol phosphorylceramide synthase n=2 Tax=Nocardioides marmoriginsengisoli TaxID=661483 RepID=A0A3N0CFY1_9ACTN|nr:inositol phosphorylceramide synthase [Nocardioides marmoriginsengisoli]